MDSVPEHPFAALFSAAIAKRGLSLTHLVARLREEGTPVALSTLSYWRSGKRFPSELSDPAVETLQRILGFDGGELVRAARASRLPTDAARPRADRETRTALGDRSDDYATLLLTSHLTVSRDGTRGTLERTRLLRAQGTDPLVHIVDVVTIPGGTSEPPRPIESVGMTLVGEYAHPDREVYGFLCELDEPAYEGDLIHSTLILDVPLNRQVHGVMLDRAVREVVLVLEFAADAPPGWVEEIRAAGQEAAAQGVTLRSLPTEGRRSFVVSRRQVGPGVFGLSWGAE